MEVKEALAKATDLEQTSSKELEEALLSYMLKVTGVEGKEQVRALAAKVLRVKDEKQALVVLDEATFSEDCLVFFSTNADAPDRKKHLVKTLKMLTQSLLDNLPDSETHMTPIVRKLVLLSQSSHRMARYCFSFAGIQILKTMLTNTRNVRDSVARYERKYEEAVNSGTELE